MDRLDLELVKNEIRACERSVRFFSVELEQLTGFKTQYAQQQLENAIRRLDDCKRRYDTLKEVYGEK